MDAQQEREMTEAIRHFSPSGTVTATQALQYALTYEYNAYKNLTVTGESYIHHSFVDDSEVAYFHDTVAACHENGVDPTILNIRPPAEYAYSHTVSPRGVITLIGGKARMFAASSTCRGTDTMSDFSFNVHAKEVEYLPEEWELMDDEVRFIVLTTPHSGCDVSDCLEYYCYRLVVHEMEELDLE